MESVPRMSHYGKLLKSQEFKTIGIGHKKIVFKTNKFGFDSAVVISKTNEQLFTDNLRRLLALQPYPYVPRIYGFCLEVKSQKTFAVITELANGGTLRSFLTSDHYFNQNLKQRLELIKSHVEAIQFYHMSPIGTFVVCDTNTLIMYQQQYLVFDNRLKLVDLDTLELSDGTTSLCQVTENRFHKSNATIDLKSFASPEEQLKQNFTHKVDIWKLAFHFDNWYFRVGNKNLLNQLSKIELQLDDLLKRMRTIVPANRINIQDVYKFLTPIFDKYIV